MHLLGSPPEIALLVALVVFVLGVVVVVLGRVIVSSPSASQPAESTSPARGVGSAESVAAAYEAVPQLLTAAERSFFRVLRQALASDYVIFAKVRLADIVRPVRNPSRSGWQSAFNRITGKHVDFVLCDSARLDVVAVIELDDRTHKSFERGLRDDLVDSALADARIPVLRVSAQQFYALAHLRGQVDSLVRKPPPAL
jgi:hypothetical protein